MAAGYCENCGQALEAGDIFCLNCGKRARLPKEESLGDMLLAAEPSLPSAPAIEADGFCPECGNKVMKGWSFCMQCGQSLSLPAQLMQARTVNVAELERLDYQGPLDVGMAVGDEWDVTDAGFEPLDAPTTVYDEDEQDYEAPTMVYSEDKPLACALIRVSTGERFSLTLPANIGRGSIATTRIAGNPFIGRLHARVYEDKGELFIVDQGSANHTVVNETMLEAHVPVRVHDGDTILLAKEEFTFSVESRDGLGEPVMREGERHAS